MPIGAKLRIRYSSKQVVNPKKKYESLAHKRPWPSVYDFCFPVDLPIILDCKNYCGIENYFRVTGKSMFQDEAIHEPISDGIILGCIQNSRRQCSQKILGVEVKSARASLTSGMCTNRWNRILLFPRSKCDSFFEMNFMRRNSGIIYHKDLRMTDNSKEF